MNETESSNQKETLATVWQQFKSEFGQSLPRTIGKLIGTAISFAIFAPIIALLARLVWAEWLFFWRLFDWF